jgi:rfaE bifunctional protein nucleotidyltransferase chain/domain
MIVRSLGDVLDLRMALRTEGRRVGATNGCFDLLHPGHVAFLEAARERVDILIVTRPDDPLVARQKGPGRPIMPLADRARLIDALRSVDIVYPYSALSIAEIMEVLRPDVLMKGGDYIASAIGGAGAVKEDGGEVLVLERDHRYSSSALIAKCAAASLSD